MDQAVIEGLQHLQLTKEEEEDISISTTSKSELLEECALSLFGRLLADRNQNSRALKSTLRSAWKLGSDLRIVDVGKNIFQFKFNSKYQMEWVERNGPWNFDNNLLLMCRWRKGLSVTNITFTHSPFWVQVWGLPFENMSEEVGRDLGSSSGKYIETDKRSWMSEQAKFMRVRVDLPINRPLRRGGNIVNPEGEKFWVSFKYERLPTFCFLCGILRHDERHCSGNPNNFEAHRQYGDWLRANGGLKSGSEKPKVSSSDGYEARKEGGSVDRQTPSATDSMDMEAEQVELPRTIQIQNQNPTHPKNTQPGHGGVSAKPSVKSPARNPAKVDKVSLLSPTPLFEKCSNESQKILVTGKEVCDESSTVGLPKQTTFEAHEVTSPLKQINKPPISNETTTVPLSPRKGNWKRIARAQGKQTQTSTSSPDSQNLMGLTGSKRVGKLVFLEEENKCKPPKKLCDSHHSNTHDTTKRSTVVAKQHRREP